MARLVPRRRKLWTISVPFALRFGLLVLRRRGTLGFWTGVRPHLKHVGDVF
jgi:hypothetical protein